MQLHDFLNKYAGQLTAAIEKNLAPIYNPMFPEGVEEFDEKIPLLLRKPFPVQGQIIKGVSKSMYKEGKEHLFIVGEMGTGKTTMALATAAMSRKPQRILVVCPTHLVAKWIRETKQTIPDVTTIDLSTKDVISVLRGLRNLKGAPKKHEVYVIAKERAKLSYGWRPAAIRRHGSSLPSCPDCFQSIQDETEKYVTFEKLEKKRHKCAGCGSQLWQADPKLKRFAPAEYIKKYMKGFFDLIILDEIQDYKAGESLQGRAMGSLLSASRKCLCLTGTLNGGYADDLFHLLFRMEPEALKADGFTHNSVIKWLETYGTLERVKKIEGEENQYGRGRKNKVMVRKRPGVSPLVIGKYLLNKSVFVRLADVIDGLPPYEESVVNIQMEGKQRTEYKLLEKTLQDAVKEFKGRALASMLQALLSYPDSCVAFPEHIEIKNKETGDVLAVIDAPKIPFKKGELLPKELELLNLVTKEKEDGRKVLCYLTFTNSRDIRPRLQTILEQAGFSVAVLDASVEPKKREAWIQKHTKDSDVLLVNAELVKTGLDLYEFPTIVFFQIGYNIYTLRQAARRSWRIGQTRPVKVFFYCYEETMQALALTLIAKKLEVSLMVEGDLPEGLAEYAASGTSIIEEMGKALVEGGSYGSAETAWANFRKKEIESQLGIGGKQVALTEVVTGKVQRGLAKNEQTTVEDNVIVKVTITSGKRSKKSTVEVKYGDLDSISNGSQIQFALF